MTMKIFGLHPQELVASLQISAICRNHKLEACATIHPWLTKRSAHPVHLVHPVKNSIRQDGPDRLDMIKAKTGNSEAIVSITQA